MLELLCGNEKTIPIRVEKDKMKNINQIREQRDLIIEYLESAFPNEYRLTSKLFTIKELTAQVMAFNWVLDESKQIDREKMMENARKRIESVLETKE